MSFAVVSLVKVIPLPQSGHWVPVSDILTGVDCGVGRDLTCQAVDGYWGYWRSVKRSYWG